MAEYRGGRWVLEFWVENQRFKVPTEITSKTEKAIKEVKRLQAQAKAAKQAEFAQEENLRLRNRRGKIVDQPICEAFAAYYEARGKDAKGKGPQNILRELAYVEDFFGPKFLTGDIDAEALIRLREKRRTDRSKKSKVTPKFVSNRAVNITLESVRWALGWLKKNGRVVQEIDWRIVMMRNAPRVTEFRDDHHAVVLAGLRSDYLPIIEFLVESGCRRGQAVALKWSDIDLARGLVTLIPQKKHDSMRVPRRHRIALTSKMAEIFAAQRDPLTGQPHHPVQVFTFVAERTRKNPKSGGNFVRGQRYPIVYEGLGIQWARFKKENGFLNVRMHDIRHHAAERILDLTGDVTVLQANHGHADIATSMLYLEKADGLKRLQKAMARVTTEAPPASKSPPASPPAAAEKPVTI